MRPEVVQIPGVAPLVPRGLDPSGYVVALADRSTLGTMRVGGGGFVPSVAAAPGALARATVVGGGGVAGALAVAGPVAAIAGLGVGIFNGVMSWRMNKKLNLLLSEQRVVSQQLEYGFADLGSTVLNESARIQAELHKVHEGVARQLEEIRLHQLQDDARSLLRLQLACFQRSLDLHEIRSDREAGLLEQVGVDLTIRARAEARVFQPAAEAEFQLTLVETQGLLAQSDGQFVLAQHHADSREKRLRRAAALRAEAREIVRGRLAACVEPGLYEQRMQEIPLFVRYWALLQGLDVTTGIVEQDHPTIGDLYWDSIPWQRMADALQGERPGPADYDLLVPATYAESVEYRQVMSVSDGAAPTWDDVDYYFGVPDGLTLPAALAAVAVGEAQSAGAGLLQELDDDDRPALRGSGEPLAAAWDWHGLLSTTVEQVLHDRDTSFDVEAMWRDASQYLNIDDETRVWIECLRSLAALRTGNTIAGDERVFEKGRQSNDPVLLAAATWCLAANACNVGPSVESARALERVLKQDNLVRRIVSLGFLDADALEGHLRRWLRAEHHYLLTVDPQRSATLWRQFRLGRAQADVHEAHFREAHCRALLGVRPTDATKEMKTRRKRYAQAPGADPAVVSEMDELLAAA